MVNEERRRRERTNMLGLVSFGFFLILLGVLWSVTPNLTEEIVDFFKDFQLVHLTEHVILPAPAHSHPFAWSSERFKWLY